MKTPARRLVLAALLAGLLSGAAGADTFDRTKARIDALLAARVNPEPLPAKLMNPFQLSGTTPAGTGIERPSGPELNPGGPEVPAVPVSDTPTSDAEILAYYSRSLKITGQVFVNGQAHLVINQSPYKEGDLVRIRSKDGSTFFFKIVRIAPNELTLRYDEETLIVPFKN
ncbi:MAG: hypothetical protein JNG83_04750 [Opitutaceae bacterium]|nr:hypothetical protein [Opitutaceae bacterium]